MKETACCIFGHRTINDTEELRTKLTETIENLITEKMVDTFLFGSKSRFDDLCLELVTKLKEKHPHVKRIYVRAEFPYISDRYKAYLLTLYDDSYYPERILAAEKSVYVERNRELIDNSHFCIVYYDASYAPSTRRSGAEIALDYALKKKRELMIFP